MRQKGYTLLELLLVISITGMVVLVVGSSIFQILQGRVGTAQKSVAIADIDNAAHWLIRDLVLAQTTTLMPGAPPVSDVTLYWSDLTAWAADEGTVEHSVSYTLSGTELRRDYDGEEIIVGRHLTDVDVSIIDDIEDKMFAVTLTSRPGEAGSTVTRSFSVRMRSELGP